MDGGTESDEGNVGGGLKKIAAQTMIWHLRII